MRALLTFSNWPNLANLKDSPIEVLFSPKEFCNGKATAKSQKSKSWQAAGQRQGQKIETQ